MEEVVEPDESDDDDDDDVGSKTKRRMKSYERYELPDDDMYNDDEEDEVSEVSEVDSDQSATEDVDQEAESEWVVWKPVQHVVCETVSTHWKCGCSLQAQWWWGPKPTGGQNGHEECQSPEENGHVV